MSEAGYSFESETIPRGETQALPGQCECIHFTLENAEDLDFILSKLDAWFDDREEVLLVDHGTTDAGLGFIVLEWQECHIDPLFIRMLEVDEDYVDDFSVYTRDLED